MNRVLSSAVVVAGLVLTLGGAVSWGQVPTDNDKTDHSGNTGGGTGALGSAELFGRYNTAYGYDALLNNTDGRHNTALGVAALFSNQDGHNNTASGYGALRHNASGSYNTASGFLALASNTTGDNNTATGYNALLSPPLPSSAGGLASLPRPAGVARRR